MNQNNQEIFSQYPPDQEFSSNVLLERLVALLRSPVFGEEVEKTRKARALNVVLFAVLLTSFVYTITLLIVSPNPGLLVVFLGLLQVIMVGGLVALRRGRINRTAAFTVSSLWIFNAVLSLLYGRLESPLLPGFVLVIFAAGFLISSRAATIFAMLSVLFTGALYILVQNNAFSTASPAGGLNYAIPVSLTFILMAIFVNIANKLKEESNQMVEEKESALAETTAELENLKTYLTQTVEENTRQLERRNRYLEAAARVAQTSIATFSLQDMLENIVTVMSTQLNFYHVGIFLLDERKEWAVLQAASSEGGRQMIARGHRLAVGRQGMVGFVTSTGRARITRDITLDRLHSITPELPETKAEMTLPLKSRDVIIGAIDIQDTNPNAFTEDDLAVLQSMADQVALAVENIRLFQQTQESLEEIERVYSEYSHKAWLEAHQKNLLSSFRYAGGVVRKISTDDALDPRENTVSIPVKVRGVTIGNIELAKDEDEKAWTDEELKALQLLSEQLGIALDSARLFNETRLRASTEHVISEINSQLWETLDINTILKNTAANLRESLDLPELTIRMATPPADQSENGGPTLAKDTDND